MRRVASRSRISCASTASAKPRSSSGQQIRWGLGVGCEAVAGARGRERQAEADVRRPGARERRDQGRPQPKAVRPFAKRQIAELLIGEHQLPVQRACRVVGLSRAAFWPPVPASRRDAAVIAALTDVVARYPRWGFWKLFDRMRTDGRPCNHKHVHRVYCAPLAAPPVLNQTWALRRPPTSE